MQAKAASKNRDDQLGEELLEIFQSSSQALDRQRIGYSEVNNEVSGKYKIVTSAPLNQFSTECVNAYDVQEVINLGGISNEKIESPYYALVFRNNTPSRVEDAENLKQLRLFNFMSPIETGITRIDSTGAINYIAIMQKASGKSLKEIINSGKRFSEEFLFTNIISPINDALNHIHKRGVVHGAVNPDNIFIDNDSNMAVLGECISNVCGASQSTFYDTIERGQSNTCAKGSKDTTADYYALGMTIFFLVAGKEPSSEDSYTLIRKKLFEGTYNYIRQESSLTGKIGDLIKGLVLDDRKLRWKYSDIDSLLKGGEYNIPSSDPSYLSRAIIFNDKDHFSRRSLAHELYVNWESGKEFVKTDKISKWLDISASQQKVIEAIDLLNLSMSKGVSGGQKVFSREDEHLIKVIIMLDPDGPIRLPGSVTFSKDAINILLAYTLANGQQEIMKAVINVILSNIIAIYEQVSATYSDQSYKASVKTLTKKVNDIKKTGLGFGLERFIYDINPSLPCQSHIIGDDFCVSLRDILEILNNKGMTIDEISSSKNLACFVASKIDLKTDIRIRELMGFPILENSKIYQYLVLLATAQEKTKSTESLQRLATAFETGITGLLDSLMRGKATKKRLYDRLGNTARSGDLVELYKVATNTEYLEKDKQGYSNAIKRSSEIADEIFKCNDVKETQRRAKNVSLAFAVKLSYVISCAVLVTILLEVL